MIHEYLTSKRYVRFSFCISQILLCSFLIGQPIAPTIILETFGSKIKATSSQGNKMKVVDGTVMKIGSIINISNGDNLLMLHNNKFEFLNQVGEFELNESSETKGMSLRSFDPLFGEYIKASYAIAFENIHDANYIIKSRKERGDGWYNINSNTDDGWGVKDPKSKSGWGVKDPKSKSGWGVKDPKSKSGWGVKDPKSKSGWGVKDPKSKSGWGVKDPKSKSGWGVKDPKSKSGWGEEDMVIQSYTPGGYYQAKKYTLEWASKKSIEKYLFSVFDEDLNTIYTEEVATNSIKFDFGTLVSDKVYYWQIFAYEERAISPPVTFEILSSAAIEEIHERYQRSNIYAEAGSTVQRLMQTVAYEEAKLYIDCYANYEDMLKQEKRNDFVRINYAAYCLRMGQNLNAKKIIEKI